MTATSSSSPSSDAGLLGVRNPRAEAIARSARLGARVLEPSPPAIVDETMADDPLSTGDAPRDEILLPAGHGPSDWAAWAAGDRDRGDWVQRRWLAGTRRLPAAPATLPATREALHRLATYVIAPVRHAETDRFGLRWTLGGFGTPFFGADRQIRVVGDQLVDQVGDSARHTTITSLAAAADFLGTDIDAETAAEHDSPPVGDVHGQLAVDRGAASFLGDWFGMAFAALEAVRHDPASVDPSRPQLWPGHFDPAIEVGDDDHRASYGASPGDGSIDAPYLYVSVWWPERLALDTDDPRWNAPSFTGAILPLADLDPDDPVEAATAFFTTTRDALD